MRKLLATIPVLCFAFLLIVSPLISKINPEENGFRIFWPLAAVLTIILIAINFDRINLRVFLCPSLLSLMVIMVYAGLSVSWAYNPDISMFRWSLQMILLFTMIMPFTMIEQPEGLIENLHWCCLISMIISAFYVMTTPPMYVDDNVVLGHPGYFFHKQYLGRYAAIAIIFAVHELCFPGRRRILALMTIALAVWMLIESKSKLALGFVLLSFVIATLIVFIAHFLKRSLLLIFSIIPISYALAATAIHDLPYRISWHLAGEPTFTGRAYIWLWIETMAYLKPWFGWGFHSFFFFPTSPMRQAPGYISIMNSAHSGYLEVRLEMGYVGAVLLVVFIAATLYGLEQVRRHDIVRTWFYLMVAVFIYLVNTLDTTWFIAYDVLWFCFVMIAAEGARYSQLNRRIAATWSRSRSQGELRTA